jgi:myo-inositol-1(or 4)-monophosphatase
MTDAELAVRAAAAGSDIVRSMFGGPLERSAKEDGDFATAADLAAERAIRDILREQRPDDGFVGEEFGESEGSRSGRRWLVDPLCGTHNYAAATPLVAVNVALSDGGRIVAAASADPFSSEIFWTDGVAARVRRDGRDQPLVPDATSRLVDLNIDPPFPNRDRFRTALMIADDAFISAFRARVISSTLALAWVAAGRYAGYVTDGDLRESVHFSSGIALCVAAGCVVTGLAGQPVHTGMQGLVAAADRTVHRQLLATIAGQRNSLE